MGLKAPTQSTYCALENGLTKKNTTPAKTRIDPNKTPSGIAPGIKADIPKREVACSA
jgi:hypothetical protein